MIVVNKDVYSRLPAEKPILGKLKKEFKRLITRDPDNMYVFKKYARRRSTEIDEGFYVDNKGVIIREPYKIFIKNKMPKFKSMIDLQQFLKKVDYNKWKNCEHDPDFVFHHFDLVKKMYTDKPTFDEQKLIMTTTLADMNTDFVSMKMSFIERNKEKMLEFKKIYTELYGTIDSTDVIVRI